MVFEVFCVHGGLIYSLTNLYAGITFYLKNIIHINFVIETLAGREAGGVGTRWSGLIDGLESKKPPYDPLGGGGSIHLLR